MAIEADPLLPTPEHPFFVRHAGGSQAEWVRASQIQVGDFVLTAAGAWTEVLAISPLEKEQLVYNFEVEENHDYFVGSTGLLVHNGTPCDINTLRKIAQPIIDSAETLQCETCAQALVDSFSEAGADGVFVEASSEAPFIVSNFGPAGEAISSNGYHVGVAVESNGQVFVFDNFANGVQLEEWVRGLASRSGIKVDFWGAW